MDIQRLKQLSRDVRKHVLLMVHKSGASHVGTSLSCADIMVAVYEVARIDPRHPHDPGRDRVILSKGHGVATWYAVLAEHGFFDKKLLETYYADGSPLTGHPDLQNVPGIETTTGSLGHGLPVGLGMAIASKIDEKGFRVFVVMGDGECDEGTVWEAALAAAQFKLGNFTVIIDRNDQQGLGRTGDIINLEPLDGKWVSFGWRVKTVDGHDHVALIEAIKDHDASIPTVIIARTVKGKGVSYMEHQTLWHYRDPNPEQYAQAIKEIDESAQKETDAAAPCHNNNSKWNEMGNGKGDET